MTPVERFMAGLTAEPWKAKAACRGMGPDLFFANYPGENVPNEVKRVCGGCPVREECGDYGADHKEFGFWGGESTRGRLRRRELSLPAHGTWERYINHGCKCMWCCVEAKKVRGRVA